MRAPPHALLVCVLALLAALSLAPKCSSTLRTIHLDEPPDGLLVDDPGAIVHGAGRVGVNFQLDTLAVRVDGVDLVAALGLVPPFTNAGGVVMVGGSPVTVSGFTIDNANPRNMDVDLAGLPLGAHTLTFEGVPLGGLLIVRQAAFERVTPFALAVGGVVAGAHPAGPLPAGTEGTLANHTVGDPSAAAPVSIPGGTELRSGLVEAAEALIAAGGSP